MATDFYTLREFADLLDELAENWDGDEPAVMIGDMTGDLSITKKDGYVQHGNIGYATEGFGEDTDPVWTLGDRVDTRFYGTMLIPRRKLSEAGQEALEAHDEKDQ